MSGTSGCCHIQHAQFQLHCSIVQHRSPYIVEYFISVLKGTDIHLYCDITGAGALWTQGNNVFQLLMPSLPHPSVSHLSIYVLPSLCSAVVVFQSVMKHYWRVSADRLKCRKPVCDCVVLCCWSCGVSLSAVLRPSWEEVCSAARLTGWNVSCCVQLHICQTCILSITDS